MCGNLMRLWSLSGHSLLMCCQASKFTVIFLGNLPIIFSLFPLLQAQCNVCTSFRRMGKAILHLTAAVLALDAWIDKV